MSGVAPLPHPRVRTAALAATPRFDQATLRELRERAVFEAGKMDPQVFDQSSIAPLALRLAPSEWRRLAAIAEQCWKELAAAEQELLSSPRLWSVLGISRKLATLIRESQSRPGDVRFARIDFHPTPDGWRASEINADVPGGFLEAGELTHVVGSYLPGLSIPPHPAEALAGSIERELRSRNSQGVAALVHATSYSDDLQVMSTIARSLEDRGVECTPAAPNHLRMDPHGTCSLTTTGRPVSAILRFFPGEWLMGLNKRSACLAALRTADVIHANPLSAMLLQSKRLPLALARLDASTPTWSAHLPEVRPIGWRAACRRVTPSDEWVLKPAWGRVGEDVCVPGVTPPNAWRSATLGARLSPKHWVLQRRFQSQPIDHDDGPLHACLGVFLVQGRAAGIYARVARTPLIDGRAQDAAVLLDPTLDPPAERSETPELLEAHHVA